MQYYGEIVLPEFTYMLKCVLFQVQEARSGLSFYNNVRDHHLKRALSSMKRNNVYLKCTITICIPIEIIP